MKRLFGVFGGLVAILLVVACAFLLYLHTHELTRTATSSVETGYDIHGNEIVTTKNTRFIFETLEKDYPNETSLLLQETHEMRQTLYEDATQSTISVQAWIGKDISPTKPAWSFRQAGDAGDLDDEETFYRITEYPQADLAPTYTFYDLITGRKVYTSTSAQLFDIIVPNTGSGFLRYAHCLINNQTDNCIVASFKI